MNGRHRGAALGKIKVEWENAPAGPDDKTIFDHIQKTAPQPRVVARAAIWRRATGWRRA